MSLAVSKPTQRQEMSISVWRWEFFTFVSEDTEFSFKGCWQPFKVPIYLVQCRLWWLVVLGVRSLMPVRFDAEVSVFWRLKQIPSISKMECFREEPPGPSEDCRGLKFSKGPAAVCSAGFFCV